MMLLVMMVEFEFYKIVFRENSKNNTLLYRERELILQGLLRRDYHI